MTQKLRRNYPFISLLAVFAASIFLLATNSPVHAQSYTTGTATLSSGKYTYETGETFAVTARLNISVVSMTVLYGLITVSNNLTITNVSPGAGFGAYIVTPQRMSFNGYIYPTSPNPVTMVTLTVRANATGSGLIQYPYLESSNPYITRQSLSVNIVQPTCPAGQIGTPPNCSYPVVDVCPNIAGTQTSVPPGMIKDASGNCVNIVAPSPPPPPPPAPPPPAPAPTDVCPNIAGAQSTIPTGMIKDDNGNCVPRPATQQPRAVGNPADTQAPDSETNPQGVPAELRDLSVQASYRSAEISFSAAAGADIKVQYGSQNNIDKSAEVSKDGESYSVKIAGLEPYTQYQYKIIGSIDGKEVQYQGKFTSRGLPVRIIITKNGSPVSNAVFYIDGVKLQTGEDGEALVELGVREYVITVEDGSSTSEHTYNVSGDVLSENDSTASEQQFEIALPGTEMFGIGSLPSWLWVVLGVLLGFLVLGALAFIWLKRRRDAQDDNGMITPLVVTPMPTDLPDEAPMQDAAGATPEGYGPDGLPIQPEELQQGELAQNSVFPTTPDTTTDYASPTAQEQVAANVPEPAASQDGELIVHDHPTAPEIQNPAGPAEEPAAINPENLPLPPAEPQAEDYLPQPVQEEPLTPFIPGGASLDPWGDNQPTAQAQALEPEAQPLPQDTASAPAPVEPQLAAMPEQAAPTDSEYDTAARPRHTSVYIEDELPEDMFEAAKHAKQQ